MQQNTFEIENTGTYTDWAELLDGQVIVHRRTNSSPDEDEVLLQWDLDVVRNLLSWAGQEGPVTTTVTGPLAHQVRQHSRELGTTPEMFMWHAVKVFIEVGAGSPDP